MRFTIMAIAVAALALGAATAFPARGQEIMTIAIDVDSAGNEPLVVGTIETCSDTMTTAGDTLVIDVIVDKVDPSEGFEAFQFQLNFDPSVVTVTAIDVSDQMIGANAGSAPVPIVDLSQVASGIAIGASSDFGGGAGKDPVDEVGEGVMARVTLQGVANGVSGLTLSNVKVTIGNGGVSTDLTPGAGINDVVGDQVGEVEVRVGQTCTSSPPAPAPPGPGQDSDGDGLSDADEQRLGTDPNNPDTDGDGVSDGQEVNVLGTDPLVADADDGTLNGVPDTGGAPPGGTLVTPSGQPTGEDATQTNQQEDEGDGGNSGLATGAWIAIGLGSAAVLTALGLGGWLARRRMRSP